jgi:hypothetical protein
MFFWSNKFKPEITPEIIQEPKEPNTSEWNECIKKLADSVRDKEVIPSKADKAAVIVEPRDTPVLYDLLVWMKYILLPHGWEIIVYSGLKNTQKLKEIEGITVKNLGKQNLTINEYNDMCLSYDFWNEMPFENILIFQIDSVLLDGDLTEFLKYDYVGSPWNKDNVHLQHQFTQLTFLNKNSIGMSSKKQTKHITGNGGLSLRRKSGMIRALNVRPWKFINEDQFFSMKRAGTLQIAPPEIATNFSTESIYNPTTLGYHKPWYYLNKDEMDTIYERMRLLSNSLSS